MGVVNNNWFDHIVLSILYMFKPSCRPMCKPPSLGPPSPYFPLESGGMSGTPGGVLGLGRWWEGGTLGHTVPH